MTASDCSLAPPSIDESGRLLFSTTLDVTSTFAFGTVNPSRTFLGMGVSTRSNAVEGALCFGAALLMAFGGCMLCSTARIARRRRAGRYKRI